MKNNLNKHNEKDLLKGKGLIYTGIFILLTMITLVIIIGFYHSCTSVSEIHNTS